MQDPWAKVINEPASSTPWDDVITAQPTDPWTKVTGNTGGHAVTQEFGNVNPSVEVMSSGINNGTDFSYSEGEPVAAPQGKWEVEDSYDKATQHGHIGDSTNFGYGNSVKLKNTETGETIRLSHLSSNFVKPGMLLVGGTPIGLSGDTGNVTAPHLDIEYTNPQGQMADITKTAYSY